MSYQSRLLRAFLSLDNNTDRKAPDLNARYDQIFVQIQICTDLYQIIVQPSPGTIHTRNKLYISSFFVVFIHRTDFK